MVPTDIARRLIPRQAVAPRVRDRPRCADAGLLQSRRHLGRARAASRHARDVARRRRRVVWLLQLPGPATRRPRRRVRRAAPGQFRLRSGPVHQRTDGDRDRIEVNVLNLRPGEHGPFDVVLAMGLLYHTPDPYRALANCAAMSAERLIVESYCIDALLPASVAAEPVMRFIADPRRFPGQGQPNTDRSNFWGFTSACLHRMVEDLGFTVRRSSVWGDRVLIDARNARLDPAVTRLARAYALRIASAPATIATIPRRGRSSRRIRRGSLRRFGRRQRGRTRESSVSSDLA